MGTLTEVAHGEEGADRLVLRDGIFDRDWQIRDRTAEMRNPKLCPGSCCPGFREPRRIAEKALAAVIQDAYIQGISTRRSMSW